MPKTLIPRPIADSIQRIGSHLRAPTIDQIKGFINPKLAGGAPPTSSGFLLQAGKGGQVALPPVRLIDEAGRQLNARAAISQGFKNFLPRSYYARPLISQFKSTASLAISRGVPKIPLSPKLLGLAKFGGPLAAYFLITAGGNYLVDTVAPQIREWLGLQPPSSGGGGSPPQDGQIVASGLEEIQYEVIRTASATGEESRIQVTGPVLVVYRSLFFGPGDTLIWYEVKRPSGEILIPFGGWRTAISPKAAYSVSLAPLGGQPGAGPGSGLLNPPTTTPTNRFPPTLLPPLLPLPPFLPGNPNQPNRPPGAQLINPPSGSPTINAPTPDKLLCRYDATVIQDIQNRLIRLENDSKIRHDQHFAVSSITAVNVGSPPIGLGPATGMYRQVLEARSRFEEFMQWSKLDRVYQVLILVATIHNAAMLSRSLGESFMSMVSTVLQAIGIKDEKGNPLDINGLVGGTIENFLKSILGAEVYNGVSEQWNKLNRILTAASGIIYAVRSIGDSVLNGLQIVTSWTGKMGNALEQAGVIHERFWSWVNPAPDLSNPFFTRIEQLENITGNLEAVASEVISIQDTKDQINEQRAILTKELTEGKKEPPPEHKVTAELQKEADLKSQGATIALDDLAEPSP